MDDWDGGVTTLEEWRERNRGLMVALSACLALWVIAIWYMIRP
jgi:hypothetical protein